MGRLHPYLITFTSVSGVRHSAARRAAFGRPEVNGLDGSRTILTWLRIKRSSRIRTDQGARVRIDHRKLISIKPKQ